MKRDAPMFRARTDDMDYAAVYGWYVGLNDKPTIITEKGNPVQIKKTTLDRWTGLFDKNDKPVYSGDVIKIDGDDLCYQITDDTLMFHVFGINACSEILAIELEEDKMEVVGNQYSLTLEDPLKL